MDIYQYETKFVRPDRAENFAQVILQRECSEAGKRGFRLTNVEPIVAEGITSAWMLFFERKV